MKAIFLDRDGIINIERGDYTWLKEDFVFTSGLFDFLRKLSALNFKFVVITNQGGVNKSLYSIDQVNELHLYMLNELKKEGIEVLDVFYCPHHIDFQRCLCRKPASQMLEKAIALYDIDVQKSYLIGDKESDVEAGQRVGVKGILLDSNPDWSKMNLNIFS